MFDYQGLVAEFQAKLCQRPAGMPFAVRDKALRRKLILEEVQETLTALEEQDLVETVDGLADVQYVVYGTAVAFGFPLSSHLAASRAKGFLNVPVLSAPPMELEVDMNLVGDLHELMFGAGHAACFALADDAPNDFTAVTSALCVLANACEVAYACLGLDPAPFFLEVHKTNMRKVKNPNDPDGKIMKPEGWTRPPIKEILENKIMVEKMKKDRDDAAKLWSPDPSTLRAL